VTYLPKIAKSVLYMQLGSARTMSPSLVPTASPSRSNASRSVNGTEHLGKRSAIGKRGPAALAHNARHALPCTALVANRTVRAAELVGIKSALGEAKTAVDVVRAPTRSSSVYSR